MGATELEPMHQTYMFYLCETILWKFAAHGSKMEHKGEKNGLRKTSVFYFHMTVLPRNMHHYTQFGYNRLSSSEDIFWTKPDRQTDKHDDSSTPPNFAKSDIISGL